MKKAFLLGILASFFFAFTFILNRSMHLSGGNWMYSASLRYLFTLPLMGILVWKEKKFAHVHKQIRTNIFPWILWSVVGFGFFYAPLSFAGDYGEAWLVASSWQITILMGMLLAPFFHGKIPVKNLFVALLILVGVFLLQTDNMKQLDFKTMGLTLIPILIAAVSYPLGNRKMMEVCGDELSTVERVYGMTLCSMPMWIVLFFCGLQADGLPSGGQLLQSFLVALFSGVIATVLFFQATDLVKANQKELAVIESTQSGEVLFTLLGSILLLGDAIPNGFGIAGICLIVIGIVGNKCVGSFGENG